MAAARATTPAADRILDAADRLFGERGIRAVGIELILAEAGTAKASLYLHFRSKDALIAAYLRRRGQRMRDRLAARLGAVEDPRERLLALFDVAAEQAAEPGWRGDPLLNASAELASPTEAQREAITEHREWLRILVQALSREAGAADPVALGEQVLVLHDGALAGLTYAEGAHAAAARAAAASLLAVSLGA